MKIISLCLSIFVFLGCEAEPGLKGIPVDDARVVSKGVDVKFTPKVDILFIIDDSGSMSSFQNNLSGNMASFLDKFFQAQIVDFHIGVTTSNDNDSFFGGSLTSDGQLISTAGPNYVDRNTVNGQNILRSYLVPGTNGSSTEKFFSIGRSALSVPHLNNANDGFYRADAHLMIFFLTDSDDQSDNYDENDFHQFLLNLKGGDSSKLHFAAAYDPPGSACSGEFANANKITTFGQLMGGSLFDICYSDYGLELAKIAQDVIGNISVIALEEVPILSTMEITFGSQIIPQGADSGWTYDPTKNVVYLGENMDLEPEPPGTKLNINFEAVYK